MHAPFWLIWPLNFGRLLLVLGSAPSLAAILIWRPSGYRRILAIGGLWAALSLLPYSFLTIRGGFPAAQLHQSGQRRAGTGGWVRCARGVRTLLGSAPCAGDWSVHPDRRAECRLSLDQKEAVSISGARRTDGTACSAMRATHGRIYVRCFPRPRIIADACPTDARPASVR